MVVLFYLKGKNGKMQIKVLHVVGKILLVEKILLNFTRLMSAITENKTTNRTYVTR